MPPEWQACYVVYSRLRYINMFHGGRSLLAAKKLPHQINCVCTDRERPFAAQQVGWLLTTRKASTGYPCSKRMYIATVALV